MQVAIVLFRTLEEFYDAPLKLTTLPLIIWRFGTIGIGSLLVGAHQISHSQCKKSLPPHLHVHA